jgi:hypothetical protein
MKCSMNMKIDGLKGFLKNFSFPVSTPMKLQDYKNLVVS